jgi:glucose-1-phosphate cytidylyltransferase
MKENKMEIHNSQAEPWKVTLVDTGFDTMTGGRVKRVQKYLNNEPFLLTYGDGVGSINIREVVDFHRQSNKFLTVTAVQPSGRFGALDITDNHTVSSFMEKPKGDGAWINGGFFVCQPEVLDYISGDSTIFEKEPLENIASNGQMTAFKHSGFWKPMDTLRDKQELENLWASGEAPWKNW